MNLIEKSFRLLYPEKEFNYKAKLKYSGRFSDYNAHIRLQGNVLELGLSKKWRQISEEIRIGLIQELMLKLFKGKKNSMYIDLYNNFIRKLHISIPKTKSHPVLEESFNRINEKYFYGLVETPNLEWGYPSKTKLGSYDFKNDTITISKVFSKLDPVLLDYIMYHEILHKKYKFKNKNGKNYYHGCEFRRKEKEFEGHREIEKLLNKKLRYLRLKSLFLGV